MHDNTYIQTVVKVLSRSREHKPSISETFVTLNVLDYKRFQPRIYYTLINTSNIKTTTINMRKRHA